MRMQHLKTHLIMAILDRAHLAPKLSTRLQSSSHRIRLWSILQVLQEVKTPNLSITALWSSNKGWLTSKDQWYTESLIHEMPQMLCHHSKWSRYHQWLRSWVKVASHPDKKRSKRMKWRKWWLDIIGRSRSRGIHCFIRTIRPPVWIALTIECRPSLKR